MDCAGDKTSASGGTGTETLRYYNSDSDGDGWGTQAAGYHCSAEANTIEDTGTNVASGLDYYVSQSPDIDEDCYCQANTYADCFDCAGTCRYDLDGIANLAYIGTSKTDTSCVTGNLSGSPGCECDVCDGAKTTWYQDSDGDGLGAPEDSISACTPPEGYVWQSGDSMPDCAFNKIDECGVCGGDGYAENCIDLNYLLQNYDTTGTCVNMDCSGVCTAAGGGSGTAKAEYYFLNTDNDEFGGSSIGYNCSSDTNLPESAVTQGGDINDIVPCPSNSIDICSICDGPNKDNSSCSIAGLDKVSCEADANAVWQVLFSGLDIDCLGNCIGANGYIGDVSGQSNVCSSGSIGCDDCGVCNGNNKDKDCKGTCFGSAVIDQCGICDGLSLVDKVDDCILVVYPGDTDMDGDVDTNDLNPVVQYWGKIVYPREQLDYTGSPVVSPYDWVPQIKKFKSRSERENECVQYADANSDGIVNIWDVTAVFKNKNKPAHNFRPITVNSCATSLVRDKVQLYSEIYNGLPDGSLKSELESEFGFSGLPDKFVLHQNYPNPFNPSTTISFSISEIKSVTLDIINLKGEIVFHKEFGDLEPGYYDQVWSANQQGAGMYFSRLFIGDEIIDTRKMVFIK